MMSSYTTSYQRIDHRTVFKKLQLEENCDSGKDTLIAGIFSPITEFALNQSGGITELPQAKAIATTKYPTVPPVSPRPSFSSLASLSSKSKIPYPLPTVWTSHNNNNKTFYYKRNICGNVGVERSHSLRRRGIKSNLPLIMEPLANETATKVECSHENTHNSTTDTNVATAGGRFYTARRKLTLISQKPSADPLLKRTLSLRKNFKYSTKTDSLAAVAENQQLASPPCVVAVANVKTSSTSSIMNQDVTDATQTTKNCGHHKDQGDILAQAKTMEKLSPEEIINGKISRECCKMSLNQNGLHSSSTTPLTTTATTNAPHPRPSTLATTSVTIPNSTGGVGLVRTPKSPRASGIPTGTGNYTQQNHSSHQHNHLHPTKTSPGSKPTPKTPPVTPDSPSTYLDDDLDSLYSYTTTSGRSTMSCEHPYVARNGTTFSGRKMKYVVHCSNYAGQVGADYLTPTQRAQRQIRRLKELLCVARQDLEQKDSELLRLTREVVELRLFKASLASPDERSASSDAVTVREAELKTSQDVSPIVDMVDDAQKPSSTSPTRHIHHLHHATSSSPTAMIHASQSSHLQHHHVMHDMQSSFADSGHFEDMTSSSVHSKDSSYAPSTSHGHHEPTCDGVHHDEASASSLEQQYELQRQELIRLYEQRIEDLVRSQDAVATDMKRSNNDRIEALLQKLAECNTRYADIVPDYEHAKERIRELEKQLEDLQRKLSEHEEKQKQMYLHMYQKGQESERIARADQALELAHRAPQNKVSINELLHQLQSTQDELENIRAAECRNECGSNHALLTAKEAISLWVLGARKTIYRRLLEAQKNRTHVDPEVTLQFLKSAVYYFLTDKENSQGHLQAIESILEFSEAEKQNINKMRASK